MYFCIFDFNIRASNLKSKDIQFILEISFTYANEVEHCFLEIKQIYYFIISSELKLRCCFVVATLLQAFPIHAKNGKFLSPGLTWASFNMVINYFMHAAMHLVSEFRTQPY